MTKNNIVNTQEKLQTACYIRLSKEDGDKTESLSIANQRLQLTQYITNSKDLTLFDYYIDDGYTGTNFERPDFIRMLEDIESRKIQCIIVKDLSRLGRDMPKTTSYIKEYFPSKKVRFIAINDHIDKRYYDIDTNEDIMIDFKNMFNGFYPRDIAGKVRSTFRSKQGNGQFIGAFASYGYKKSPTDKNKLIIDETAANIVRRIYQMYLNGFGQLTIAKQLNKEGICCPSEYKKQCGLNYHNNNKPDNTSYWTYATIHKMLKNEMYIGNMVQNKSFRPICQKKAMSLPKEKWIVVENTHEAIIDKNTWNKVQNLLEHGTRQLNTNHYAHVLAGYLRCGDCQKAMVKIKRNGVIYFNCGNYNRYGKKHCSMHQITEHDLEQMVLHDLNRMIQSVKNSYAYTEKESTIAINPYTNRLLQHEKIEHLDRETVVEMISMIYVYENSTIKIVYNHSDEQNASLQNTFSSTS